MNTMIEKHFQYWVALTAFSVISLTSLTNHFQDESHKDWSREQRWVISVTAINLFLSVFSCLMHLGFKGLFLGTKHEVAMTIVVLVMWVAGLPAIMDEQNEFAVMGDKIANGNLFFSSWGGFIVAMMLMTSHWQRHMEREDKTFAPWVGLGTASFVVMANASRRWRNECDSVDDSQTCRRTMFGIVLGVVSLLIGFGQAYLKNKMCQQVGSIIMLVAWCFAASYLTYDSGPATEVGTLYFSTWAALFFVLNPATASVLAWFDTAPTTTATGEEGAPPTTEGDTTKADVDPKLGSDDKEEEEIGEIEA